MDHATFVEICRLVALAPLNDDEAHDLYEDMLANRRLIREIGDLASIMEDDLAIGFLWLSERP